MRVYWTIWSYLLWHTAASAATRPQGIGAVAGHLMEPVSYFSDFIYSASIVLGASFVFAGIIRYVEYRRNPLAMPISTVVFFFVAGVFLLGLPFAHFLIHHATVYSLFKSMSS